MSGDDDATGSESGSEEEPETPKTPKVLTKAEKKKAAALEKKRKAAEAKAVKVAAALERKSAAKAKKEAAKAAKLKAKEERLAAKAAKAGKGKAKAPSKKSDEEEDADGEAKEGDDDDDGDDDAKEAGDDVDGGDVEMTDQSSKSRKKTKKTKKEKKIDPKKAAKAAAKAKKAKQAAKAKAKKQGAKKLAKERKRAERRARRGAESDEGADATVTMLRGNRDRKRRRRELEQMPDLQPHPQSFEKVRPRMPWPQIIALICNTLVLVTGLVAAQVMCLFMGVCATTDDPAITAQTSAAIIPTALLVIIVAVLGLLGTYIDIPLLVLLHVVVSIALAVWCVIAALWAAFSAPLGDDAWGMVTYTQKQWYSAAGEEGFKAIAARNHFTAASFAAASCILLIVTAVVSTLQLMSGKKARQGESDIYRHWIARRRRKERRAGERRHVNGSRG